jgi:DNA polymerase-3 subunit alpha
MRDVYDIEIPDTHNFILDNGAVAHNCAHAVNYSYLSYLTAWLKYHYPTEFMCAILNSEDPNSGKLQDYKQVAKEMGIEILPPDIINSQTKYSVLADKKISTGLMAVKGIGDIANEYIVANRPYTSFAEFLMKSTGTKGNRSPITKTVIESLTKAGCFDILNVSRKNALEHWQDIKTKIATTAKKATKNNISIDFDSIMAILDSTNEFSKKETLQYEMEVIGHYLTGSHNDVYGNFFRGGQDIVSLVNIKDTQSGQIIKIEVVVKTKKELKIKKKGRNFGKSFAKYLIEDTQGQTTELTLWPDHYEKYRKILIDGVPIRALCEVNEYMDTKSLILRKIEDIANIMND